MILKLSSTRNKEQGSDKVKQLIYQAVSTYSIKDSKLLGVETLLELIDSVGCDGDVVALKDTCGDGYLSSEELT